MHHVPLLRCIYDHIISNRLLFLVTPAVSLPMHDVSAELPEPFSSISNRLVFVTFPLHAPSARDWSTCRSLLISFSSFWPDKDQGNPGRNVVFQNKNCAGAEGEDIVWFFRFLLGHVNLLALPQHQHTSFLCPDVSYRIALSFFKELLNKGTVTKSSRLRNEKTERNQKQSTILEKWQNSTVICLANALNVRARWKCHRKTNTEKNTGSTNKKQLEPENDWNKRNREGGGGKDYKYKTRKQKCKIMCEVHKVWQM